MHSWRYVTRPLLLGLLLLFPLLISQISTGDQAPSVARAQEGEPGLQQDCPGAPSGLDADPIERDEFCVYYDDDDYTETQATDSADDIDNYWDRYDNDFNFSAPKYSLDKLQVILRSTSFCNGFAPFNNQYIDIDGGCYSNPMLNPERPQTVLGHELFHAVQYNYDEGEPGWVREGTARAMEDMVFDNVDNWANAAGHTFSFNNEVDGYLTNTNADLTSAGGGYPAALWWKFFTEQYGSITTEPERGVDAMLALWEAAANSDSIAATNQALLNLEVGVDFEAAFRQFTVANWTKDLNGVPDDSYRYIDEDQPGNAGTYGPIMPAIAGGPITIGANDDFRNLQVNRYAARYMQADVGDNCPVITATFDNNGSGSTFYHVVTQKGNDFAAHRESTSNVWSQSFINDGITRIVAIAGSLDNTVNNVDVTLGCANPVMDIFIPNQVNVADIRTGASVDKFLAQVIVTDGSADAPVVAGLTNSDFKATVNGIAASITGGGFVQQQYWLVIQAPRIDTDGTYDLEVSLEKPGTATEIASDIAGNSVRYSSEQTDHVLVVDRSDSMANDGKIEAARDAANFYVDITRGGDGLAVVPYNQDVNPQPFDLQAVNATVRSNAQTFINDLMPDGFTSIGDGMNEAANQRTASPTGNDRCSFVLLSDGIENRDLRWADVESDVRDTECPVTAIAFGEESDELLMQQIAEDTAGQYFFNDVFVSNLAQVGSPSDTALSLANSYEYADADIVGRERLDYQAGTFTEEVTETIPLAIDASVNAALITLDWDGFISSSDTFTVILRDPSGNTSYTPAFLDLDNGGHIGWRIQNPIPNDSQGTWEIEVYYDPFIIGLQQQAQIPYQVIVSGNTSITAELLPINPGLPYATGENVPICTIVSSDQPESGLSVAAVVTAPDGTSISVPMYDDGSHDDGTANDGLYCGRYRGLNQAEAVTPQGETGGTPTPEGSYQVRILVTGPDFKREVRGSFAVEQGADTNTNGLPDPYEQDNNLDSDFGDPDGEFFSNPDEFTTGTDPNDSDTDGGGENDSSEVNKGQNPFDPNDDQIEAPDFFSATPDNAAVVLNYDARAEYTQIQVFRSAPPNVPWNLLTTLELPLTGVYTDSDNIQNGTGYQYRIIAVDSDDHRSAVRTSDVVTPSVDPVPPAGIVLIDNGAIRTADREVQLAFAPAFERTALFQDIAEVQISNDPRNIADAPWQPLAQNIDWTLADTAPDTTTKVYVRFRDSAGNVSRIVQDSIRYEPAGAGTSVFLPVIIR
jgi:Mg-chelatase subunit ChlD